MRRRKKRMTIDELTQGTGVSSRNIRYYQTRNLLPPPTVEGRTGYYDERHVERLALIQELQGEGLNLQAIGWLLGGSAGVDPDELRRLKRAVLDGWVTDAPIELDAAAALEGLGVGLGEVDAEEARRAIALRLAEPVGDGGSWRILLPAVLAAGKELHEMGVPREKMLDVLEGMRGHADAVARSYVKLFDEAVLAPWDARGRPANEWPEIRQAVERIRPLAGQALLAVFHQVMAEAISETVEEPPGDESTME